MFHVKHREIQTWYSLSQSTIKPVVIVYYTMLFTTIPTNYREDHIPHSCGTIIKKLRMLQEEIIMTVTPKFIKRDDQVVTQSTALFTHSTVDCLAHVWDNATTGLPIVTNGNVTM